MANCSKIRALAIPENYTGDLTLGVTTELSASITVDFKKSNNIFMSWNDATTDGSGNVLVTIDAEQSKFFSSKYDFYEVFLKDSAGEPLPFVYESEEYDYLELPFSISDCDLATGARTLTVDTSEKCC